MASVGKGSGISEPIAAGVPDGVEIQLSGMRSTNLDRDLDTLDVVPLRINARVQDVLGRVASAIEDPARSRVWSLTGPYGSGKSTAALLAGSLLGRIGKRREDTEKALSTAHGELANRIVAARDKYAPEGFIVAAGAARQEAISSTLVRVLLAGVVRYWGGRPPGTVTDAVMSMNPVESTHAEIIAAVKILCKEAPLLLVIDEFGKSLEYFAAEGDKRRDDIYLLQELAELAGGRAGLPLFIITLQHLSFNDYAVTSTTLQQKEWAKIQGRFEDVIFSPDLADSVSFIKEAIRQEKVDLNGRNLIKNYADQAASLWTDQGLDGLLPGSAEDFAALYPVHPLTSVAVPLVAAQVGQHDRSLAGFLVGDEPFTVRRFVENHDGNGLAQADTVRLSQAYDYFFSSGRTTILASANASRWIEIDQIIGEAHGLNAQELEILKTIGILNLIDASGSLRASERMLYFALNNPGSRNSRISQESLVRCLSGLVAQGHLIYRKFNDEYRIWRGSNVQIEERLIGLREKIDDRSVVNELQGILPIGVVAGRHSQRSGFLRYFYTVATTSGSKVVPEPTGGEAADGLLVFHFGDREDMPTTTSSRLPVVVGISKGTRNVLDLQRELIALGELDDGIVEDPPAKREIAERSRQFRAQLAVAFTKAFKPSADGTAWYMLGGPDEEPVPIREVRSFAGIVSKACDAAFPDTPEIRNEMLGRHVLTSQGAKARRELISAMVTAPQKARLGFSGYGPEVAMYEGVLKYMGLHQAVGPISELGEDGQKFDLMEPTSESPLYPAWQALRAGLVAAVDGVPVTDLGDLLGAPPYGVKAGTVPVILTAAFLLFRESVSMFEEGTYVPTMGPELMERLFKAPAKYTVKYISVSDGVRSQVLTEIANRLSVRMPAAGAKRSLLVIVQNFLNELRALSPYAKQTKAVSTAARAVRQTIMEVSDPDDFIFSSLPKALGLTPFKVGEGEEQEKATEYADRLFAALDELRGADQALRKSVIRVLSQELRLPPDLAQLRRELAIRVAPLQGLAREAEMSGFIDLALNEDLADDDWLSPVAVRLVRAGLPSWNDQHLEQFKRAARRIASGLDRLATLHEPTSSSGVGSQNVQLVTLTNQDGHSSSVLVHVPEKVRQNANKLAESVLATAEAELGADGQRVLLAALAALLIRSDQAEASEDGNPAGRSSPREEP